MPYAEWDSLDWNCTSQSLEFLLMTRLSDSEFLSFKKLRLPTLDSEAKKTQLGFCHFAVLFDSLSKSPWKSTTPNLPPTRPGRRPSVKFEGSSQANFCHIDSALSTLYALSHLCSYQNARGLLEVKEFVLDHTESKWQGNNWSPRHWT